MNKIYTIDSNFDFQKISFATLKCVQSETLYPRVLTNAFKAEFSKIFKKMAQIDDFLPKNMQIFQKVVHFDCYDIGLYFYQNARFLKKRILSLDDLKTKNRPSKYNLIIFDGNGFVAGNFFTNVFDDLLFCDEKEFLKKKTQILDFYKKLKNKNLLVQ